MKKLTLRNIFVESKETSPFAPKDRAGNKNTDKDKEEILYDDKKTCMCTTSPCNCNMEEALTTGGPTRTGSQVVEAPKVPGGGPEFEHDPYMENPDEMDAENEFEIDDDFDFSNIDPSEEEDFALDDDDFEMPGLSGKNHKMVKDDESFRSHDFDYGRFVDPEDF